MEIGKGWHEWFMSRDFVISALRQLEEHGVPPDSIKLVPMSDKMRKDAGVNTDLVMFYHLDE